MTSREFILWLKGFTEGVHEYGITPKQWDILKDKLAEVNDEIMSGTSVKLCGTGGLNISSSSGTSTTYGYPSGSSWSYTSTQTEPTNSTSERQLLTDNHD